VDGLFYGGGLDQLWRQAVGAGAVLVYSLVLTFIIGFVIQKTIGFRIAETDEVAGIDNVEHAESGYDFTSLGGGSGSALSQATGVGTPVKTTEGVRA
jgi:Amt family ammonium transporter